MSLEYSDRICPFWQCSLGGKYICSICSVDGKLCGFKFAKEKFLSCSDYLSEVQKKIKG